MAKKSLGRFLPFLLLAAGACSLLPPTGRETATIGVASWYGPEYHGQLTSSREIFDMHDMTAAHRTLPFGTYVMVTNLDNDRSTVVRINDRGPFVKGRIIDLSFAAARVLDMIGPGTARVRVDVLGGIREQGAPPGREHWVQAGAFTVQENATALLRRLEGIFSGVRISTIRTSAATYYRVRIKAKDRKDAEAIAGRLSDMGLTAVISRD